MSLNHENQDLMRHTFYAGVFFAIVLLIGTCGYMAIEGWPAFDAFYMTVITLATIGYGETHPLTATGRIFTILLIFLGVGYLGYAFGGMTRFFATGGVREFRRRRNMERLRLSLRDHVIVCGGGRLGTSIVESLREKHAHIVVIDRDRHSLARWSDGVQVVPIAGDATDDEVLKEAGVDRAAVLVAALNDDAANVFLTLSARGLNPNITLFAKADDPATMRKLERAGCNHPFSPGLVTGHRIAAQIMRPTVTQILALTRETGSTELSIDEVPARALGVDSSRRLRDLSVWGTGHLLVLAVHHPGGEVAFPPREETLVHPDDLIVLMGKSEALQAALRGDSAE
jgi:voltage-gated potassium channel